VAESSYLRYPHIACDLITFAAEDDVWLTSLSEAADGRGTQARRLTADRAPVLHPRLNPAATHVAWDLHSRRHPVAQPPLLDRLGCADDLHDLLRELQGETRTSHTGVLPPGGGADPSLAQGLLGADLDRTKDGTWRIARILPSESSVIGARSPLAAPGIEAAPGDLMRRLGAGSREARAAHHRLVPVAA